jgi:hypothetical protein
MWIKKILALINTEMKVAAKIVIVELSKRKLI